MSPGSEPVHLAPHRHRAGESIEQSGDAAGSAMGDEGHRGSSCTDRRWPLASRSGDPAGGVRTGRKVVSAIAGQRTTIADAIADGQMVAEGDPAAAARFTAIVDERIFNRLHA
jgi:hypothetical protein